MVASRAVLGLALFAACGGARAKPSSESEEEGETERGAIPDDVLGPPKVAWNELDHDQRARFMEKVVVPTMKPLFVAFDATTFQDFDCATCHGPDAREHKFAMPNPSLFVLHDDPDNIGTLASEKPAWVKLMTSEVEPEMAKLLGRPERERDHSDPAAFGCTGCHTTRRS